MSQVLPLFKSSSSLLRSTLTLDNPKDNTDADLPDSVFKIAIDNGLKEIILLEDSMSSFLQFNLTANELGIKPIFGYRVTFVADSKDKSEASWISAHKNVIFPRNKTGYKQLIKIATLAGYDNHYKEARLSYDDLHGLWTEDLALVIPFYDSFLHKNLLTNSLCVPDYRGIKPTVFIECNDLPFDYLIEEAALAYAKANYLPVSKTKSIYYKNREDFDAYLTLKCLNRKQFGSGRTLDNPDMEHMSSREFCWESYLEAINK